MVKVQYFEKGALATKKSVDQMSASGGGDFPEAVTDGLFELSRLNWRENSRKVAVLIGDAPPHGVGSNGDSFPSGCPCGENWRIQILNCRETGISLHAVSTSASSETVTAFRVI